MIGERRMRFKQALAQLNVEADWYAIQALSVTAPYAGSFVKFPR